MAHESIYTWIAPPPEVPEKPPLYHAKADPNAPLAGSTIVVPKKAYGTMGMTKVQMKATVKPENFLRAHQNTGWVDASALPAPHHKTESKVPPVPRRDERPHRNPKVYKDFVTENAIAAITMKPRATAKEEVNFLAKESGFGQVPAYLSRVKQEIEDEREYILHLLDQEQMAAEAAAGSHTRELTDDERGELLEALKTKWDAVNHKYQIIAHRKISASTASLGEIRWKEDCERQMSKLEADIKKLSIAAPIFVVSEH